MCCLPTFACLSYLAVHHTSILRQSRERGPEVLKTPNFTLCSQKLGAINKKYRVHAKERVSVLLLFCTSIQGTKDQHMNCNSEIQPATRDTHDWGMPRIVFLLACVLLCGQGCHHLGGGGGGRFRSHRSRKRDAKSVRTSHTRTR